jgi:RNA polymerase sigma factor (sigma-70 family)
MLSGSGAVRTSEIQRSTTVRSLYTGIRIDSFIGYKSHGSTAGLSRGSKATGQVGLAGCDRTGLWLVDLAQVLVQPGHDLPDQIVALLGNVMTGVEHDYLLIGRRRVAAKRGGAAARLNLEEIPDLGSSRARELIALDDALHALAKVDPRKARVIELRFFAGLSVEETAAVLEVSGDTVKRDWKLARAWLSAEMRDSKGQKL